MPRSSTPRQQIIQKVTAGLNFGPVFGPTETPLKHGQVHPARPVPVHPEDHEANFDKPATPAIGFVYQKTPQLPKVTTYRPEAPLVDHIHPKVTTYRPKIDLVTTPQPHVSTYRPHEHTQDPPLEYGQPQPAPLEYRQPQPHSHQFYRDGELDRYFLDLNLTELLMAQLGLVNTNSHYG